MDFILKDANGEYPLKVQIAILKAELAASDYKAIKHSEGLITEEDYAPIKAERQAIRDRINELQIIYPPEPSEPSNVDYSDEDYSSEYYDDGYYSEVDE